MEEAHKIGDFLVSTGLLTEAGLARCFEIADKLGLPIGKVIVFSGLVKEPVLRGAILVQSLVRERQLDLELAQSALKESARTGQSIEDILLSMGWKAGDKQVGNRIGELLVEAGAITKDELSAVIAEAEATGLPLGRVLSAHRKIKDVVIWSALNAQVLVRDNLISREQAIRAVKAAVDRKMTFERGMSEEGLRIKSRRLRLGELLVLSGLISDDDLMGALEVSILEGIALGQILVQKDLLSAELLHTAIQIQQMVEDGQLQPLQAADVLHSIHSTGAELEDAIAQVAGEVRPAGPAAIRLGELLKLCGWVSDTDIEEAAKLSLKNSSLLGKMLLFYGYLNESALSNALRCQELIREGRLEVEQAIVAMHYTQRTACSIDTAMRELGWGSAPAREDYL